MERDIIDLIEKYRDLKGSSFYPFESRVNDTDLVKERKESVRRDFQRLKEEIENFPEPQVLVDRFRVNVGKAVEKLLDHVGKSRTGAPLDRNQGMVIENFVFGKVSGIIRDSLKYGRFISYPQFYYQPGGDFDETELRELLLDLREELKGEFLTYFDLENCVDGYLEKIRGLWERENEAISK
jgi:hypothetical protein